MQQDSVNNYVVEYLLVLINAAVDVTECTLRV